jgi:hypothetical protein
MKKFTASNDQQTNTQSKSCAAGELDEQDLCARGSALYGRVSRQTRSQKAVQLVNWTNKIYARAEVLSMAG